MSKGVTFCEKDRKLIQDIEKYQKKNKIPTFIDTVRILCKSGLQVNELIKNVK